MGKVKSLLIDLEEPIDPSKTLGELIDSNPDVKTSFEESLRAWELDKYTREELETALQRKGFNVLVWRDEEGMFFDE